MAVGGFGVSSLVRAEASSLSGFGGVINGSSVGPEDESVGGFFEVGSEQARALERAWLDAM